LLNERGKIQAHPFILHFSGTFGVSAECGLGIKENS
jgi:hypothetical protein